MADKVFGANSMVRHKGKMIQIQSQLTEKMVVTVVIVDGQVRKRYETDVSSEVKLDDSVVVIQKILNKQHKEVEMKIRSRASQLKKAGQGDQPEEPIVKQEEPEEETPKKRGLLDTILRRRKERENE